MLALTFSEESFKTKRTDKHKESHKAMECCCLSETYQMTRFKNLAHSLSRKPITHNWIYVWVCAFIKNY